MGLSIDGATPIARSMIMENAMDDDWGVALKDRKAPYGTSEWPFQVPQLELHPPISAAFTREKVAPFEGPEDQLT